MMETFLSGGGCKAFALSKKWAPPLGRLSDISTNNRLL
jgi:hypothetical protein